MKTRESFITSPLGILLGGATLWYLAGMLTVAISFEKLGAGNAGTSLPTTESSSVNNWSLFKVAGIWAGCGAVATLVLVARVRLAYQRYLTMPSVRTPNPLLATIFLGVAFAALLGLVGGLALAHWYLPSIETPTGLALKSGRPRYAAAAVAAIGATILTVPAAVATLTQQFKRRKRGQ